MSYPLTPSGLAALGRCVELLLDPAAGSDEVGWRRASAEAVADLVGADHAYLQISSSPRPYVGTGIAGATFAALERELVEAPAPRTRYRDPEMERLHRRGRRGGASVFTRDDLSRRMGVPMEETRIFQEVCVPAGLHEFAGVTVRSPSGDAMLWVSREGRDPGFVAGAEPRLEVLRPAFEAALRNLADGAIAWPAPGELRARFQLTPREAEVALLLARGASEKRLARALDISVHTARRHTERVFAKLGVRARSAVASQVLDLG